MKLSKLLAAALALCAALPAMADGPYRAHRYDSFMACPPAAEAGNQIVFLGNSITNMHNWTEAFGVDARIVNRGNSGGFAYEWIEEIESVVDSKPAKVFIGIGTNDLSSGEDNDATVQNIDLIVKRIQLASPQTEIYVQSILPRSSNEAYVMPKITDVNAKLKAKYEGTAVHFIDLTETMAGMRTSTGTNPATSWACDGLHPTGIGYRAWCNFIKDDVNGTCAYSDGGYHADLTQVTNPSRVSQFSLLPVKADDIIFLGDEMVENGEWNELLGIPNVLKRANGYGHGGMGIAADSDTDGAMTTALGMLKASLDTDPATQVAPKQIIIYTGVWELISGSLEQFQTRYQKLVDYITTRCPETKILALSLLDINGMGDKTKQYNAALQELAEATANMTYCDIYTPMQENKARSMSGNYVSGLGYVLIANLIASEVEGANAVSLDDFMKYYAQRTARRTIGKAYNMVYKLLANDSFGSGLGEFSADVKPQLEAELARLGGILASSEEVTGAEADGTADLIYSSLNMPQTDVWYVLKSHRGNRIVSASGTNKLLGVTELPGEETDGHDVWKFTTRTDGKLDIVNAMGRYINPNSATSGNPMKTMAKSPTKGWEISYSLKVPGTYVIYAPDKNAQFNQSGAATNDYALLNWGCTNGQPTRNDDGCSYYVEPYTGTVNLPEEDGLAEVTAEGCDQIYDLQGRSVAHAANGLYIINGKKVIR